ncbi:invertebrate-type lysozyme 3-like [Macrosteles quadrilineatus]|uniref:invertebrate-type lysozyme 3-like n=1 Tax=Macrosteles quadrilineatus TaxID=74068 RepID=UPI0023E133D5|nr:invertebrate-type lysozyme 3-like [Macrosteles quadrilineatus]
METSAALLSRAFCLLFLVVGSRSIDDGCIKCLCEAINEAPICNYQVGCHDGVCGPYAITMPYWVDGGRPTVGLEDRNVPSTYEKCSNDVTCAEATIRGYMNKFHQDCNQDGSEDCFDYAAVHFHGGYNCNQPLREPVRRALDNCLRRLGAYPQPGPGELPGQQYPPVQPERPQTPDLPIQPEFPRQPELPVQPEFPIQPSQPESTTYPSIDIRFGENK